MLSKSRLTVIIVSPVIGSICPVFPPGIPSDSTEIPGSSVGIGFGDWPGIRRSSAGDTSEICKSSAEILFGDSGDSAGIDGDSAGIRDSWVLGEFAARNGKEGWRSGGLGGGRRVDHSDTWGTN
eukprot:765603-Amorphochlora_amoeboformis.AAC.1